MTIWILWYVKSRRLLLKNKGRHLKLGYLTYLVNVTLGKFNTFYDNVIVSDSVIGDFVYVAGGTKIGNATIGKFCSIGPDVKIGLGMHPTNFISTFPAFFSTFKQAQVTFAERNYFEEIGCVKIGNDVWIGENAIIMSNVVIGDGAIIGAGAIVTRDVQAYAIVGGVPARLIRLRFTKDQILKLLELKWWDRDISELRENHALFNEPELFFEKFKP